MTKFEETLYAHELNRALSNGRAPTESLFIECAKRAMHQAKIFHLTAAVSPVLDGVTHPLHEIKETVYQSNNGVK